MPKKINAIFFDFDGTLFDTAPDIRSAYLRTFEELKLAVDPAQFKIGPPMRECILGVLPESSEAEIARISRSFVDCYDNSGFPATTLYPGIPALLDRLQHCRLFIATNKRFNPTWLILEKFRLWERFEGVYAIDTFPGRPPKGKLLATVLAEKKIAPDDAVIVGDTAGDITAGQTAGIATCGVTWGYGTPDELAAADRLIDHPAEF